MRVAMVGNPNVGKTALLNAITGGNFIIGNFPGTTVEKKEGKGKIDGIEVEFIDLPGTYSLEGVSSPDEKIARDYIMNEKPNLILNVVDASNLERNLYLTLQVMEFEMPMVIALNLIDEAKKKGIEIDSKKLERILGVPVVETIAVENVGVEELKKKILEGGKKGAIHTKTLEERIDIAEEIARKVIKKIAVAKTIGDMFDEVFTDKYLGIPIFFSFMWMAFRLTYDVASPLVTLVDLMVAHLSEVFSAYPIISDGVITGVGSVLVFVPNIAFLFVALAILELSGYMARAVFIMDKTMERFGLNGRSVVPLIMGFGCNVPAILATRAIEDKNARIVTLLVNPFISCSARLPIYVLFAGAFFSGMESAVIMLMYLLGIVVALFSALLLRKFVFKGEGQFIMEFPPYRFPKLKEIWILTWNRTKHFLRKAGTIIFVMSIVIWFLTNYPSSEIRFSYAGMLGDLLQPIFAPMGWEWELSLALIMGFVAKEVVVETLGIVLGDPGAIANLLTPAQALGFMVFTLLYMPCVATLAVIKAETEDWRWTAFAVSYGILIAYFLAFLISVTGGLIL